MKKILLAIIAVLCINTATAQFKVVEKQKTADVVWSSFGGHQALWAQEQSNGEYYFFLAFNTTNQFDDKMIISLGKIDKAKATLSQLLNDLHKEGEVYELADDKGEAFTMQCSVLNQYKITKSGYAGYAYLTLGQVSKMLSCFTK